MDTTNEIKSTLKKYPKFHPEGFYTATLEGCFTRINADCLDQIFLQFTIPIGRIASARTLYRSYARNHPTLYKEIGALVDFSIETSDDLAFALIYLQANPGTEVDLEISPYCGDDFFLYHSIIRSVHPPGTLPRNCLKD